MKIKKLNKTIIFILIFLISIGFAYLSATLNINGTAFLRQNTWNIYFDNVEVQEESIELSEGDQEPTIDTDKTTVSSKVTFNNPGDEYIFNIDTVNDGTLHAQIDLIETTDIPEELQNIAYIKLEYLDGTEVKVGDVLMAGSTKTLKVITGYKEDITEEDLPTEEQNLSYSITINYKQIKESDIVGTMFLPGVELSKKMIKLSGSEYEYDSGSHPQSYSIDKINPNYLDKPKDNAKIKNISDTNERVKGFVYITSILRSNQLPSEETEYEVVSTTDSEKPIFMWYEEGSNAEIKNAGKIYWYSDADVVYLNEDSSNLFYYYEILDGKASNYASYEYLNNLEGFSDVNTSKVKNMTKMFYNCINLTSTSFMSNWNISKVESLRSI